MTGLVFPLPPAPVSDTRTSRTTPNEAQIPEAVNACRRRRQYACACNWDGKIPGFMSQVRVLAVHVGRLRDMRGGAKQSAGAL
jgi:hypothetical protein